MRGEHNHHVISQQALRSWHATQLHKARLSGEDVVPLSRLLNDRRNQMKLKPRRHMEHEYGPRGRLTRDELPESAEEFADEYGLTWLLDRKYGERHAA